MPAHRNKCLLRTLDWQREFIQAQRKCGYDSILLWKLQFPTANVDSHFFFFITIFAATIGIVSIYGGG